MAMVSPIRVTMKNLARLGSKHQIKQLGICNDHSRSYTYYFKSNLNSLSKYTLGAKNRTLRRQESTSAKNEHIRVTFVKTDGTKVTVKTSQDKSLYDAVIDNSVDIDGFGACEATLCCTTCHLILKESDYNKIGEPRDEELDMLDLAYGLTDTSRLGCQVILKKDYDPLEVQVPAGINDVREA